MNAGTTDGSTGGDPEGENTCPPQNTSIDKSQDSNSHRDATREKKDSGSNLEDRNDTSDKQSPDDSASSSREQSEKNEESRREIHEIRDEIDTTEEEIEKAAKAEQERKIAHDNYKRRSDREIEEAEKYANQSRIEKEIIPVLDEFNMAMDELEKMNTKAIDGSPSNHSSLIQGIAMVYRKLDITFKNMGLGHPRSDDENNNLENWHQSEKMYRSNSTTDHNQQSETDIPSED